MWDIQSEKSCPLLTPGTHVWVCGSPLGRWIGRRRVQALQAASELFRRKTLGCWVGR